ncbi:DUF6332 family protein [Streptomyces sp. NPDC020917]|uniref:DUF6332 family protein n=1 Tax=Streptomyces sp. NPDC020917 TaxID=3365102 RepID=UPI0037A5E55B
MRRGRTRAERDAVTVEIACAVLAGAVLAVGAFLAVSAPVLLGAAHGQARKECFAGATVLAAAVFCSWVARTLRRFDRQNRLPWLNGAGDGGKGREAGAGAAGPEAEGGGPSTPPAAHRVPPQRGKPGREGGDGGPPRDQPSQPGRTSPDS